MYEVNVTESATLNPVSEELTGKRYKALLVKSGWGSKMYYPAEMLAKEGPKHFKAGTPVFFDHMEGDPDGIGKVRDLAGELATDAVYDAQEGGLVAEVEIYEHNQAIVKGLKDRVGLSIRARAKYGRGSMEGRSGRIATGLVFARSVDLVTKAGAGGRMLDVIESDTNEEENMDEVLEAINAVRSAFDERFAGLESKVAEIQESMTTAPEEVAVAETQESAAPALTADDVRNIITEALAATEVQESAPAVGTVETDDVEESANIEVKLPSFWVVKESK